MHEKTRLADDFYNHEYKSTYVRRIRSLLCGSLDIYQQQ